MKTLPFARVSAARWLLRWGSNVTSPPAKLPEMMTGLIRVFLRSNGVTQDEPAALDPGSTVTDVADSVHHELAETFAGARVWGPSAKFDGQKVGREHQVQDGDTVEILKPM